MLQYDVVVIGASSAGLFAAEILAKNGKRVALFEIAAALAPAPRTYIITPGLFRVISDLDQSLIRHQIHTIQLQTGKESAEIGLKSADLIIERSQLIENLFQRAINAGVEAYFGAAFLDLENNQGNIQIRIQMKGEVKKVKADCLIGGDGIDSQVRKSACLKDIASVPLIQAEIDLSANWDDSETKVWFTTQDTPYFYWLIPDRGRKAVVGLIAEPGDNIKMILDKFLDKNLFQANDYQTGQAALYDGRLKNETRVGDLRILLVGDAASQVKVTTVGGTVTGLEGGKAAAAAILSGQSYYRTLKTCRKELSLHSFIRDLLHKMSAADYTILLNAITKSVQSFLEKHDRDAMRWQFWKLVFIQPKFVPLGLKLLFRSIFSLDSDRPEN